jgi:hypothetical protein
MGPAAQESLRWTKMTIGAEGKIPNVVLEGTVSVYRGFYPQRNPPTIKAGGKEVTLAFQGSTLATGDQARWQVRNANEQGVVLDESLNFELILTGDAWKEALIPKGAEKRPATVEVKLGSSVHKGTLPVMP